MIKRAFQDITNLKSKHIKLTIHRSSHRRTLLRWLFEVCNDFRYTSYTYVSALIIIDTFTQKNGFDIDEYQLIGISSLFLAAKIEERQTKKVIEYSIVTDGCCTTKDIISKEREVLESLKYDIIVKLPHAYFNTEYFRNNFADYEMEEKKAVFYCVLAALMERSSSTKNMFLLYLEAVREMEFLVNDAVVKDDVRFYLEVNSAARDIMKNRSVFFK